MNFLRESYVKQFQNTLSHLIGYSFRVSLVTDFGFLSQNVEKVAWTYKYELPFRKCRWNSGDTQRWWGHHNRKYYNQSCLNFLYLEMVGVGCKNIVLLVLLHLLTLMPFSMVGGSCTQTNCFCLHSHPCTSGVLLQQLQYIW